MTADNDQTLSDVERNRLQKMWVFEEEAYREGYCSVGGADEAGRGPLAGPVVAAVCVLPRGGLIAGVNDSKKLTPNVRERLFERLTTDPAIIYGVGVVEVKEIDRINIYQATIRAIWYAVEKISAFLDCLLVDGMKLSHPTLKTVPIIKGDEKSLSIAAASIIAKVFRDRLMCELDRRFPLYGFAKHKGYGTPEHLAALLRWGPCSQHRQSFKPVALCYEV